MAHVLPGAEPWSAEGAPGAPGVLVLHGFTGNPSSVRPLAEHLAERGFAVELPRLPGHGTHWRDLKRTDRHDWTGETEAALELLRQRTAAQVVVGLSMGAMLALHLAATRGEALAGIVLINPWIRTADPRLRAVLALRWLVRSIPGVGNDIAKPGGDERAYHRIPLRALASQQRLQAAVRAALPAVRAPTLLITSRTDHVIEADNAELIRHAISSTDVERLWLERSYHVATLDHDADLIAERTAAFITRTTASR